MGVLPTLVSVDEYRHAAYDPDRDFVDGVVLERNAGEKDHAKLQREFLLFLHGRRKLWNIFDLHQPSVSLYRNPVPRRPYEPDAGKD